MGAVNNTVNGPARPGPSCQQTLQHNETNDKSTTFLRRQRTDTGKTKEPSPCLPCLRPLEERDLAEAAAIEATAPDAWSEDALRAGLAEQQAGGAARLFAAEWRGGAEKCAGGTSAKADGTAPANQPCPATGRALSANQTCANAAAASTLAGIAAFQLAAGEASLDTLTVAPAFRRQGVGRALLWAALSQLHAEGAAACFLEVRESNAPAIALYKSLGFSAVGRRRGFYRSPAEDALVMRCELPPISV